jgi:uracil-DNA glycosylase
MGHIPRGQNGYKSTTIQHANLNVAAETELTDLNETIARCRTCSRLVRFRESVPKRASFREQEYWRRPVPGFGDPEAWLLVLGLAPAAHGGNRTGRVFTGDESARFLTRVLYKAGFANKPTSESRSDGLMYSECYVTAAVKCVPPENKPTQSEFTNCGRFLDQEFALLRNVRAVVCLGRMACTAYLGYARRAGATVDGIEFGHGARLRIEGFPTLYCAYHPSPRNTHTGKLTEAMLLKVFNRAKKDRRSALEGGRET